MFKKIAQGITPRNVRRAYTLTRFIVTAHCTKKKLKSTHQERIIVDRPTSYHLKHDKAF